MPDPFNIVLSSFDIPEPCFSSAEVGTWPGPDVDALAKLDVLRDGGTATHISCSACGDGHVEEVQRIGDDQRARFFIICPTAGRVRVTVDELKQWTIGVNALADHLARALGTKAATSLVAGRLWRLATTKWGERAREVLLARGLSWEDAAQVISRVPRGGPPIVLVASPAPAREIWRGVPPAVVSLARVLESDGGTVSVNAVLLKTLVDEEDVASRRLKGVEVDEETLAGMVRREAAKQAKTQLPDETMAALIGVHGTSRKAQAALKEEGIDVHHTTIYRAGKRAGGAKKLRQEAPLRSVEKSVALQRRNGRRNP